MGAWTSWRISSGAGPAAGSTRAGGWRSRHPRIVEIRLESDRRLATELERDVDLDDARAVLPEDLAVASSFLESDLVAPSSIAAATSAGGASTPPISSARSA